jgi:hypothetical protein
LKIHVKDNASSPVFSQLLHASGALSKKSNPLWSLRRHIIRFILPKSYFYHTFESWKKNKSGNKTLIFSVNLN